MKQMTKEQFAVLAQAVGIFEAYTDKFYEIYPEGVPEFKIVDEATKDLTEEVAEDVVKTLIRKQVEAVREMLKELQ